jgi:hypothetical protein
MFRNQPALFVTALIALAANACATREARPVSAVAVACPGGTVHSAAEAARYAACDVVQGDLTVAAADLSDLSSLSRLRQVSGNLTITRNPELEDLSGLENLRRVGALEISHNGIYSVRGLGQLSEVGELVVESNRKLNSLSGLRSLSHAGSVTIEHNPMLCAMGMLPALDRVDSPMQLRANRGISKTEARLVLERAGQGDTPRMFAEASATSQARR